MATSWGTADINSESKADEWGMCCIYAMSEEFHEKCPELARRLVYAHSKAIEFMYTHPYNAAMMFADGFDTDPYVALRTIYMKTVAEGRTITWQFTEQNLENYIENYTKFPQIPEEEIPRIDNFQDLLNTNIIGEAGVDDFDSFIASEVDPVFPIGMTFEDWYNKAKEVDNISDEDAVDISDTATPYLNENLESSEAAEQTDII